MAEKMHPSFLIFTMIGCIVFVSVNSSTTHIVGDNLGWSTPPYHGFFDDWTKNRTFSTGDTLRMCHLNSIIPLLDIAIYSVYSFFFMFP